MARQWKPGDFVVVKHGPYRDRIGMVTRVTEYVWAATFNDGEVESVAYFDDNFRPLVVIDPESRDQIVRLRGALNGCGAFTGMTKGNVAKIQAALRFLVADPKPDEPQGLGAVVEDESGNHWVRHGDGPAAWMLAGASPSNRDTYPWSGFNVVRVLSEGWSE